MTWTADMGHGRDFCLDLEMAMDIRERWLGLGNSIVVAIVGLEEAFATESGIGPRS